METTENVIQKITALQGNGKFDQAAQVYFADLTCDWEDFPTNTRALGILRPFFANGIDQPPIIDDEFNQARLAVDLAHAYYHQGQLAEFEAAYGVAFERYMTRNIAGNLQGHLVVFGNLLMQSNQLARAERAYQFALRLAGDNGFAPGICHLRFMELYVETGQWDKAADSDTRYELAMPDIRDRVYEDSEMVSFRAQMQIVQNLQPLSHSDWEKAKFAIQDFTPACQRVAIWMGELLLRSDELAQAADHFNTVIRLSGGRYANPQFKVRAQGGLARLAALDDELDEALEMALACGEDYSIAEVYRLSLDREKAIHHAKAAYKWAWADGPPYVHVYGLERASNLFDELGKLYPEVHLFQGADPLPHDEELQSFIKAQGNS